MKLSLRAGVGALLAGVLTVSGLALAIPTGAEMTPAAPGTLSASYPNGPFEKDNLTVTMGPDGGSCDSNIVPSNVTVLVSGVPITDSSKVTVVGQGMDAEFGLIVHPSATEAPGGVNAIGVSLTCDVSPGGGGPAVSTTFNGAVVWAQIDITKTVVGAGPTGGQFAVTAACTPPLYSSVGSFAPEAIGATSLNFLLTAGQTGTVFATVDAGGGTCEITETNNLGATSSSVTPGSVTILAPTLTRVSVSNTFPDAVPTPEAPAVPKYTG